MISSGYPLWLIIPALGIGTYLIRLSFLGLVGGKPLSEAVRRHLRYTGVAIMPGLVAPLIVWPDATGGTPDLPRIAAAAATLGVGFLTRSVIWAVLAGAGTLYGLLWLV